METMVMGSSTDSWYSPQGFLDDVRQGPTPSEQWMRLERFRVRCEPGLESYNQLLAFAADDSLPLLIRAKAFDEALALPTTMEAQEELSTVKDSLKTRFPDLYPAWFPDLHPTTGSSLELEYSFAYTPAIKKLMHKEMIEDYCVYPTFTEGITKSMAPVRVCAILDKLITETEHRRLAAWSGDSFEAVLGYLLDHATLFQSERIEDLDLATLRADAPRGVHLARFQDYSLGREDHQPKLQLIEKHPRGPEFRAKFEGLGQTVEEVARAFPSSPDTSIILGAEKISANALYAVEKVLSEDGRVSVKLPLNQRPDVLPFATDPQDAAFLLDALLAAYKRLQFIGENLAGESDTLRTVRVNMGDDFFRYRLLDVAARGEPLQFGAVHIRPYGALTYDPAMEHGRNGEGVEATCGYDLYSDGVINIRLDREGWSPEDRARQGVQRDPTQPKGTLSMDIASVLGNEQSLGTRLGRFLAWGNVLRAQAFGTESDLNHAPHYFSRYEGYDYLFARRAEKMVAAFEALRLSKKGVAKLFGGRCAVKGFLN